MKCGTLKHLSEDRGNFKNEARPRRSSIFCIDENIERVRCLVLSDSQFTFGIEKIVCKNRPNATDTWAKAKKSPEPTRKSPLKLPISFKGSSLVTNHGSTSHTLSWNGIVHHQFLPEEQIVNAAFYMAVFIRTRFSPLWFIFVPNVQNGHVLVLGRCGNDKTWNDESDF